MKLLKYSFLCAFMLSGASCLGMEQKVDASIKTFAFNHPELGRFDVIEEKVDGYISFNFYNDQIGKLVQTQKDKNTLLIKRPFGMVAEFSLAIYRLKECNVRKSIWKRIAQASKVDIDERNHMIDLYDLVINYDALKQQGLGKYMFLYALQKIKSIYPNGLGYGWAVPLDGRPSANLYKFYEDCGARRIPGTDKFYIDLEKLDLGIFAPKSKL